MLESPKRAAPGAARRTIVARYVVAALAALALGLLLFQPTVANQLGYALPVAHGLPCRVHYDGGTYDNDWQCAGGNMTSWMTWTVRQHRFPAGGRCLPAAQVRPPSGELKQVAEISTLFGPGHAAFIGRGSYSDRSVQPLTLFVRDGPCYRPYDLEVFP